MAKKFIELSITGEDSDHSEDIPARDLSTARAISSITNQASASVASAAHGLLVGDIVTFAAVGGMVEINGRHGKVTVSNLNNFTVDIDSSLFGAYTVGGTATPNTPMNLAGAKVGIVYDDTVPSGDLAAALHRGRERVVQLES